MTTSFSLTGDFNVLVKVAANAPADAITRGSAPGFPYWQYNGEPLTVGQVMEHLVHNALRNGVTDASDLDGWADLEPGMLTMSVEDIDVDATFRTDSDG